MSRICIKLGGRLLADVVERRRMAEAMARLHAEGHELLLVHGGGAQLGEASSAMGLQENRHQGLRITDAATARVATWILAGEVNKALVQGLVTAGLPAVGLCGVDLQLFQPRRKIMKGVDLGYVGELAIEDVDGHRLDDLISGSLIPVLATVGPEAHGEEGAPLLNVNADEAAGPIAAAAGADELLFLSDVEGVQGADGRCLARLTPAETLELIDEEVISGGMIPKVRAALAAVDDGVPSVRIASGQVEDPIRVALEGGGTCFVESSREPHAGKESG